MHRSNLARLGFLIAIVTLPACSGGGVSTPVTPNSSSVSSVRMGVHPSSLIGNAVQSVSASPSPSPTAVTVKTSSLIGNVVHSVQSVSASPSPSPTAAIVKTSSLIGNIVHAVPVPTVAPSASP